MFAKNKEVKCKKKKNGASLSLAGARDPSPIASTCDCFHSDAAAATAAVS